MKLFTNNKTNLSSQFDLDIIDSLNTQENGKAVGQDNTAMEALKLVGIDSGSGRGRMVSSALCGTGDRRHLEGRKYGILKFGRFWKIAICNADNDILHPLNIP